jgi:type I restriction enzyme S subunit
MISKLSDICSYVKSKVNVSSLDNTTYVSTENMLPNKGGVVEASALPLIAQTQSYEQNDILVSNIRPYFKKIWIATQAGGCSNDVLVFRAKEKIDSEYLYYVLSDDMFFEYSMVTSKGTKMPRGDREVLMKYKVPNFDYNVQRKIASFLSALDAKIRINTEINKNLVA